MEKAVSKSALFKNFNEQVFLMILEPLNVINITYLRQVCKRFSFVIQRRANEFKYLDSINFATQLSNIHILKIIQRFSSIKVFKCHQKLTTSELARFLEIIKPTLKEFHTSDSHIDFSKLFRQIKLPQLEKFVFQNTKKIFQDVDIRSFTEGCPNILYLDLSNVTALDNRLVGKILEKIGTKLETFIMLKNPKINYEIFVQLAINCFSLKRLEIGGHPHEFNNHITYEGIESLTKLKSKLKVLKFEFCAKIGDMCIQTLAGHFGNSLEEFSVIRNYYEKVAKISDESLKSFQICPNLTKLELVYSRKFDANLALYLSKYFTNLRVLNLSGCPIQVSLEPLTYGCPHLEEVNLSGDSWVKKIALIGIAKHKKVQIFHLGHFEHSDFKCQKVACEFPPKGFYIAGLFEKPENFPNLQILYLEENCDLSDFLVEKISRIRPKLLLRFNRNESLIGESLDINDDDDDNDI